MSAATKVVVNADEMLVRTLAVGHLSEADYQVIERKLAEKTLAALRLGGIDLLSTDVHMPGEVGGLALARFTRQNWPRIHVIITSGNGRPAADEIPEGKTYFRKPYQIDRVLPLADTLVTG